MVILRIKTFLIIKRISNLLNTGRKKVYRAETNFVVFYVKQKLLLNKTIP